MKKLQIRSSEFDGLLSDFSDWLLVLGYHHSGILPLLRSVREYLHYMEAMGLEKRSSITVSSMRDYYAHYLKDRPHRYQSGSLSATTLNQYLLGLDRFTEYLRKVKGMAIPKIGIRREAIEYARVTPLTLDEIASLYRTTICAEHSVLALIDRAILSIYYDCGLRRNEGIQLTVSDVHFDKRLLEVRYGKGDTKRFIPFSKHTSAQLQAYLYDGRPTLVGKAKHRCFFMNTKGHPASGAFICNRLKSMQAASDCFSLQEKRIYPHLLRHSIATHLLSQGMSIDHISKFLGHRSLGSTQLYTHIIKK